MEQNAAVDDFFGSYDPAGQRRRSPVPPEVLQHAHDWPLPNKDYSNTRATADSAIDSGNVKGLEMAWSVPINATGLFGSASTNPLILGDTVYFQDLSSNVFSSILGPAL